MSDAVDVVDFRPTTDALADLVRHVRDEQLGDPTPCPDYDVADLLDHLSGLSFVFTAAARKQELPRDQLGPVVDGSRLPPDWRDVIATRLGELADAWRDPAAYAGTAWAGPVELPASVTVAVAVDEVTIHAWDLAVATGQEYAADPAAVAIAQGFVDSFEPPPGGPADDGGLFGPPVDVPDDAPPLHRLLAAAGRDPSWRPPTS